MEKIETIRDQVREILKGYIISKNTIEKLSNNPKGIVDLSESGNRFYITKGQFEKIEQLAYIYLIGQNSDQIHLILFNDNIDMMKFAKQGFKSRNNWIHTRHKFGGSVELTTTVMLYSVDEIIEYLAIL